MRDDEFKSKLTEVAEWEIPVTMEPAEQGRTKRQKKLDELGQNCFNPTYPPKIKTLKHTRQNCEDCGKTVEGRQKDITVYRQNGRSGLKEKCVTCGLHKDPYTGEFTLNGTEASIKWNSFCKPNQRRYKVKEKIKGPQPTKVITDGDSEIRIYHEIKDQA